MNGAGVVSTPPKPAPRPLAKPPLPRRSTSDAIPVPSPKPATSPKPPPPAVAQKPKPGQAPLVSPKPPPPTRPRSISAGSLPSPGAVPPETNGGTPPPVALKPKPKPKPPVKRKSFITTPQQSIDSEENAETAEALPKERSAPASEEVISKALGTLSEGSEQREGQTSLENKYKDNTSLQAEENRENSRDVSKNETSQSAGDVVRNSDAANLLNHAPDKEQEHCETSRNDSIDNTAATPSKLPIAVNEEGKDSCKILLPHDKRNDKSDSAPTEADLETSNTSITKAFEASATESSGVSSNIVPCSESPETPQVTAKPTPTSISEPEGGSGATDPALSDSDDDDNDDACEEIEDSTRKEESVEHRKPPVPAPRPSLSSVTSEVSSLDSYDFLNTSRGGNSFKSQRSSQSIRSQGSSCLGSDSEDESGVFEVQPDIPEEDEELEKIKLPAENTNSCEKDSLKGQSSRISVFADLQEKEGHIAEGDIVLVSVTSGGQRNSKGEEDTKSKESGQVVPEQEHSGIQKSTGEQSVSNTSVVVGQVDDHTGIQGCIDTPENTEDDPSLAQVDIDESGDVNLSKSEKSELHLPEVCDNIQKSEGAKREVEQEGTEEDEEETEDSEEEEEQFDEMGKRIFSLSRKKKPGVLKYSSGEFHEQYEASGKEKDISESSKSKDPKKKPKKEPKKGKKDAAEEKTVIEDVPKELAAVGQEEQGATSEEERPSKPPRTRPQATPEELEVGRASTTSDVSTSPLVGEGTPRPVPVRRVSTSLSTASSRPNISLKHRVSGIGSDSDEDDDDDDDSSLDGDKEATSGATVDISKEEHTIISGGAGAVVTRVDSDGEEEVFIGGMPSSSMCTQTAFTDQASAKESAEVSTPQQKNNDQQFHHFATIEPVGDGAQRKESPSVEASAAPTDTLTTLSENQSVTISVTGSEPLSDSGELLSQQSEHALNKPWSEVAAVTVAATTMPGPLVPEYTLVEGDSSTTSSTSSLVPCQPSAQESKSHDSSLDDGDDDDDEDDDDERSMYDKIDIHDESYKSKDWKYRETAEEIGMMTQPRPENADEVAEATDTVSQLSESSTTASEKEFKSIFGERPHRIQRRKGSEDFVRLSRISRERTISFHRQDGTYGLRIQKSKPVVVTSLDPGGPAENAGLKVGDMILRVNGQDVRQLRHSEVVKLATEAPEPLVLVVGTVVCNSLNLSGDHTIMCGYMHKLASVGMIKQWRRRWFALKHDNCLYYYKTEHDILPQGAIVLQNYTVTKARDAGKQFSFKLTKEGARTYYFSTANEEERSSWGKAINDAANPNHKSDVWLDISTHNVSLPALSIKDPECTGFLTKWNSKMKNARRRYCVLKDACLYYYKEMDALDAQGVVHLHGYSIQETELKGKKFSFTLKPPDVELREFYFFADHDTDRKRWVSALASSIGRWIQTNNPDDGDDDGSEMYI